jgi:cell wall-associated NlpC family hydrolase
VPTLTPNEIYNVCISVGFTPDQAVTWTAIAMAESGGNTEAHNPHGEDSRGLWQINVAGGVRQNTWGDLNDPYANARAAYEISHGGTDMRPWTTTHASNAGTPHDYRYFMADAQAASGGAYHGDFSGVSGYRDPNPMGGDEPGGPHAAGGAPAPTATPPPQPDLDRDGAPDTFEMSRGTNPQDPDTDHDGLTDGFELAHGIDATVVDTDHDGLSDAYEVQIGTNALSADTDGDSVGDAEEVALGRDAVHGIANLDDPAVAAAAALDSDEDGLSDALEGSLGTNINLADTDGDHLSDALEYAQGSDPVQADTDHDGILDDVDIDDHTVAGGLASIGGPGVGGPGSGGPGLPGASPLVIPVAGDPLISPLAAPEAQPAPAPDPAAPDGHNLTQQFLDAALAQTGDSYVFGAEAQADDANPTTFDCSELAQWAASRVGIDLPDGSWHQYLQLKEAGAVIPVDQAVHTPGALLFRFDQEPTAGGGRPGQAHVAISLGDGTTIEARGRAYGVGSWETGDRFTYAAIIPGLGDASDPVAALTAPPPEPVVDTDVDGAPDPYELAHGTNPQLADSDGDGLTDGFEMTHGTNPLALDSDIDGLSDAFEVQAGLNAMDPDADHDGFTDAYELAHLAAGGADPIAVGMAGVGQGAVGLDSDHDGLSDAWESSLGTNPLHPDTDGDQISDAMEEAQGTDPLVANHHDDNDFDAPEP